MMNDMSMEQIKEFKEINNQLLKYGWMLGPLVTGGDVIRIKDLVLVKNGERLSDEEIRKINKILISITFNPNYRAHYMERAQKTEHIKKYSHYIERAILHYYKGDYFSTVLILLPAIVAARKSFSLRYNLFLGVPQGSLHKLEVYVC